MRLRSIVILVSILAVVFGGWVIARGFTAPHSDDDTETSFVVAEGWGVKKIATELKNRDLIGSIFFFNTYVWIEGVSSSLQAGSYQLAPSMSIRGIVNVLSGGATLSNERVVKFTEGWTSVDIGEYLEKQEIVTKDEYLAAVSATDSRDIVPDKTYAILATKPAAADLEGFLFPDTYRVFTDTTATEIVERQLDALELKIDEALDAAIAESGHSFFEILTMASILEKEVRSSRDRAIAADIFWRRIDAGIALQSDATINYITGKGDVSPSLDDLEVTSSYNTYKNKDLPPGPISNPSLAAIKAAVYPEGNLYWYFLTKPDGTTVFSKNYEEHLANKEKYLK